MNRKSVRRIVLEVVRDSIKSNPDVPDGVIRWRVQHRLRDKYGINSKWLKIVWQFVKVILPWVILFVRRENKYGNQKTSEADNSIDS